jgi:hypothetical protein
MLLSVLSPNLFNLIFMKLLSTAPIVFLSCGSALAQNNPCLTLGVQTGVFNGGTLPLSSSQWNQLAPSVSDPDTSFFYSPTMRQGNGSFTEISVMIPLGSMKPLNGKLQPMGGVTLGIGTGPFSGTSWSRYNEFPYDTLISSQTGQQYFIDSINWKYQSKEYTASAVMIGLKIMLQTTLQKRWSMSFGGAVRYGFSYDRKVTATRGESSYYESITPYYSQTMYSGSSESQSTKGPASSLFWVSAPVEVNYRLGKRKHWQYMSLAIEGSIGSRTYWISGYGSATSLTYSAAVGLKYNFIKPHSTPYI